MIVFLSLFDEKQNGLTAKDFVDKEAFLKYCNFQSSAHWTFLVFCICFAIIFELIYHNSKDIKNIIIIGITSILFFIILGIINNYTTKINLYKKHKIQQELYTFFARDVPLYVKISNTEMIQVLCKSIISSALKTTTGIGSLIILMVSGIVLCVIVMVAIYLVFWRRFERDSFREALFVFHSLYIYFKTEINWVFFLSFFASVSILIIGIFIILYSRKSYEKQCLLINKKLEDSLLIKNMYTCVIEPNTLRRFGRTLSRSIGNSSKIVACFEHDVEYSFFVPMLFLYVLGFVPLSLAMGLLGFLFLGAIFKLPFQTFYLLMSKLSSQIDFFTYYEDGELFDNPIFEAIFYSGHIMAIIDEMPIFQDPTLLKNIVEYFCKKEISIQKNEIGQEDSQAQRMFDNISNVFKPSAPKAQGQEPKAQGQEREIAGLLYKGLLHAINANFPKMQNEPEEKNEPEINNAREVKKEIEKPEVKEEQKPLAQRIFNNILNYFVKDEQDIANAPGAKGEPEVRKEKQSPIQMTINNTFNKTYNNMLNYLEKNKPEEKSAPEIHDIQEVKKEPEQNKAKEVNKAKEAKEVEMKTKNLEIEIRKSLDGITQRVNLSQQEKNNKEACLLLIHRTIIKLFLNQEITIKGRGELLIWLVLSGNSFLGNIMNSVAESIVVASRNKKIGIVFNEYSFKNMKNSCKNMANMESERFKIFNKRGYDRLRMNYSNSSFYTFFSLSHLLLRKDPFFEPNEKDIILAASESRALMKKHFFPCMQKIETIISTFRFLELESALRGNNTFLNLFITGLDEMRLDIIDEYAFHKNIFGTIAIFFFVLFTFISLSTQAETEYNTGMKYSVKLQEFLKLCHDLFSKHGKIDNINQDNPQMVENGTT